MKDLRIIIAFLSLLLWSGCEKMKFQPEPGADPVALFEELWNTFRTDYGVFAARGVDWQAQYDLFRPQVDETTSDEELAEILEQMLRTLDDGHVSLIRPNERIFYSNRIVDEEIDHELFDLNLIKDNYFTDGYRSDAEGANTYGWMGNIGYLHLKYVSDNLLSIGEILDYFRDAEGLIVDLRHNSGGDFTYSFSEFGRFTDQERFVFRSRTKNGPNPTDFTDWYSWSVQPAGTYFAKPIVLLTDRYTISAGERTVMAFKVLPNVTHLGDTTNGAFSTKIHKELPNGWYYSVATQQVEFMDGESYEGRGLSPDVFVKNTAAEMAEGKDRTLEAAIGQF
jgi:hypothetical protein